MDWKNIKMNKQKTSLFNFILPILLISMLPKFSLHVITSICQVTEGREEICEIKEIESNKKDYRSIDFFPDADVPILTHSIHPPHFLITVFEPKHISTYSYFLSDLFNHSPPAL